MPHKDNRIAIIICLVFFVIWFCLLEYKYFNLGYYDWDLAFFSQACWQLLHASQFTSITGINYFGDHSYFITLLTLPFFALFPHPLTLILLKLSAFIIAAYLFYRIAYESLGQSAALALMVLYILFPANIFSMLYEFNPECFAPPALFWMFMAFQKKQWRSFFIASILLMLIKENMPLLVCAFGLWGLFHKGCPPKIAWGSFFLGAAVFYVLVIDVVPYFRHLSHHAFVVRYAYLGHSVGSIIFNLFTQPQRVGKVVFLGFHDGYIQSLFGPLLVPALFSWQILLLMSPVLLQHLLSNGMSEHSIYYHYGATMAPFIFLATMRTLCFCSQRANRKVSNSLLLLLIAASAINLYGYKDAFVLRLNYHHDRLSAARWALVDAVPPQQGVITTFDFLAPLSLREHVYTFHKVYDDSYQNPEAIKSSELNTGGPFVLPDQVRYALIDFKDAWIIVDLQKDRRVTSERIQAFLRKSNWTEMMSYGSIVLLKR